ncbi:hypothetical protein AGMMS49975_16070 [Clostridia bacterium]|nr:hypothetical protein AGMMS49975_16070 [Clostridia bacterium]
MFKKVPEIISGFEFTYKERNVTFSLQISSIQTANGLLPYRTVKTESKLLLDFEETGDLEFLLALYHLVHNFFAFLCNRQNISLSCVKLQGSYQYKGFIKEEGKNVIGDKIAPTTQTLFVVDKYKEQYEDIARIAKTISYMLMTRFRFSVFTHRLTQEIFMT